MHYKDGTEAKLGDVVKGEGYNVKGVIVGTVVHLTPGSEACNIQIVHPIVKELPPDFAQPNYADFYPRSMIVSACRDAGRNAMISANLGLEYGQCDAFELIHRPE
jgi:hypothetical protein